MKKISVVLGVLVFVGLGVFWQQYVSAKTDLVEALVQKMVDPAAIAPEQDRIVMALAKRFSEADDNNISYLLGQAQTDAQREKIRERFSQYTGEMVKRTKSLVNERLDLVAMVSKYNTQVFSEHFSKEELEVLYKFYSDPVGEKALRLSFQLLPQIQQQVQKEILPIIKALEQQLEDEYQNKLMDLVEYTGTI